MRDIYKKFFECLMRQCSANSVAFLSGTMSRPEPGQVSNLSVGGFISVVRGGAAGGANFAAEVGAVLSKSIRILPLHAVCCLLEIQYTMMRLAWARGSNS